MMPSLVYAFPITYNYSGRIIKTYTSLFMPLEGQEFSGSFTYDTDDIDLYISGLSNFYPAINSTLLINPGNYVNFTNFDWHPLIITDTTLEAFADNSSTQGHDVDWLLDSVDLEQTSIGLSLGFFGAPSPEFIFDGLTNGTLSESDFLSEEIAVTIDGNLYPLSKYLHLQVVETTGPEIWDLRYHNIYGEITNISANVIPEPTTIALLGIGIVGLAGAEIRRRRKKNSR